MTTENPEGQEQSLEINLQFDDNGRTKCTTTTAANNDNSETLNIDYDPKAMMTNLKSLVDITSKNTTNDSTSSSTTTTTSNCDIKLDDLLFDCEIADCGLLPRTYWMPANKDMMKPRCWLEEMAYQVFHHHVGKEGKEGYYDPITSGAEWWVQIRPSPSGMGRYAMLSSSNDNDDKDMTTTGGISFHWDKDEDLRLAAGGNLYVHPHLSTVTYLSNIGAPTMVCHRRIHPLTGEWLPPGERDEGYLCWPQLGKHLSFDGRYLHAAPSDFLRKGEWEKQIEIPSDDSSNKESRRRYRRVTFLVNIWLNYRPFNVNPFPESMIDKLSKVKNGNDDDDNKFCLFPSNTTTTTKTPIKMKATTIKVNAKCDDDDTVSNRNNNNQQQQEKLTTFTWPMGCSNSGNEEEEITIQIPLNKVHHSQNKEGNFHILWENNTLYLTKTQKQQKEEEAKCTSSLSATTTTNKIIENDSKVDDDDEGNGSSSTKRQRLS